MMQHETDALARTLVKMFGTEVWDDDAHATAERVMRYWHEYMPRASLDFKLTTFPTEVNQLIVVNNIEFSSMCAHHLLPFWGIAHIGYIPNQTAIGLSKIPRIVDHFARRPQIQERLTAEIATFLKRRLHPQGVAVIMIAKHTCMACRGVRKHNGHMTTSEMRGVFLTASSARSEFLQLINTQVTL